MEAIAALGLASNIVQFVDFAWNLLTGTRELYASGKDASEDVEIMDTVTEDIQRLNSAIMVASATTADLRDLAQKCQNIAGQLLAVLQKLKIDGEKTRWKCFLAAMKGVLSKRKIDQLTGAISTVQSQVSAHIQHILLNNVSDLSQAIQKLHDANTTLGIACSDNIADLKKEIIEAVDVLIEEGAKRTRMQEFFNNQKTQTLDTALVTELSCQLQHFALAMQKLQAVGMRAQDDQFLLKKLHYNSMSTRQHKIENAHAQTFLWLVNSSPGSPSPREPRNFGEWLRAGNGVFWIYGKPGSGKSTLMKFICSHERVKENLKQWAEGDRIVTASFYFWNAGTPLQKTAEGLLRTLLFEILRQYPSLIGLIQTSSLLAAFDDADWTLEELLQMYRRVSEQNLGAKFCFFIDGLDEFEEENRSHRDLVHLLRELEVCNKIKLCIGSRPWTEFGDEYGHDSTKTLKLEDLTRGDIYRYVQDKFNSHSQFAILKQNDLNYDTLVQEVVDRAQGVFLWVRLVVSNLLEGFTFHDSVDSLRMRLETFPEDLDEFFKHMLKSISPVYRRQAARTFKIASTAEQPHLLMFYSFLDEVGEHESFVPDQRIAPLSLAEVASRQEKMRRQLDGRSRGLLEITVDCDVETPPGNFSVPNTDPDVYPRLLRSNEPRRPFFALKVDFLHRTVRDFFLTSRSTQLFLEEIVDSETDLYISASKAALAQLKFADIPAYDRLSVERLLQEFFFYCRHAAHRKDNWSILQRLVTIADLTYNDIAKKNEWGIKQPIIDGLAAQNGLIFFLENKYLQAKPHAQLNDSIYRPILDYALTPVTKSFHLYSDVVEFLLNHGAQPNQPYRDTTVWANFLCRLLSTHSTQVREEYFEVARFLISHGAFLDQIVNMKNPRKYEEDRPPSPTWRLQRAISLQAAVLKDKKRAKNNITARQIIAEYFDSSQQELLFASNKRWKWFGMLRN